MLTELHIENLGIIEKVTLQFGAGFTVFTGETGAGKTMLVEAIGLVVGGRADPSVVRSGATEARVEGRFVRIVDGTETETVLTRVVAAGGGSRAYIDGRPATVASLTEAASSLVDIHGQHGHQRLMRPGMQRAALDDFAGTDLMGLRGARAAVSEIEKALAAHGGDERERAREIDLLRHEIGEIDSADLVADDEDEMLDQEEALLSDVLATKEAAAGALGGLVADLGPVDGLRAALGAIGQREVFAELRSRLKALVIEVEDAVGELRRLAETLEEDPERLARIRERRQLLRDLRRKYGDDVPAVRRHADAARERLATLEDWGETVARLSVELSDAVAHRSAVEEQVRLARSEAAPRLSAAVQERLAELGLAGAVFEVVVGSEGAGDEVTFMLAANPGSPAQPLAKVASGGELSRTMLALRLVLADDSGAMVFDEVDAGLGGGAGVAVGRALAEVARGPQVFAVTHLAQVAAAADHQVLVSKTTDGLSTHGVARILDADSRVSEIARMLSGGVAEEEARGHALRLLEEFPRR
jgi:DNA repair protein RecN (Recombination protein N)